MTKTCFSFYLLYDFIFLSFVVATEFDLGERCGRDWARNITRVVNIESLKLSQKF